MLGKRIWQEAQGPLLSSGSVLSGCFVKARKDQGMTGARMLFTDQNCGEQVLLDRLIVHNAEILATADEVQSPLHPPSQQFGPADLYQRERRPHG